MDDILQQFTLQADDYDGINDDELKELVWKWALKKKATQFQTWKKTLYNMMRTSGFTSQHIRQDEHNAKFQYY